MTKNQLIRDIEDQGEYTKVRISRDGEATGMLAAEDHRYDAATNTGGRRLIQYIEEA